MMHLHTIKAQEEARRSQVTPFVTALRDPPKCCLPLPVISSLHKDERYTGQLFQQLKNYVCGAGCNSVFVALIYFALQTRKAKQ